MTVYLGGNPLTVSNNNIYIYAGENLHSYDTGNDKFSTILNSHGDLPYDR